jgi:hypothetical protein
VKNIHTPCENSSHKSLKVNPLKNNNLMFDDMWALYPKKKAKKESEKAWAKLTEEDRLAAIARLKLKPFKDTDIRYVPLPSTYINGARWEDELTTKPTTRSFL